MRGSAGLLIVAIGLVVLWIATSKRYECFAGLSACLTGGGTPQGNAPAATPNNTTTPTTPTVPGVQAILDNPRIFGDLLS